MSPLNLLGSILMCRHGIPRIVEAGGGTVVNIARIALFLASDESRMITGTAIPADGGRSACFKPIMSDA